MTLAHSAKRTSRVAVALMVAVVVIVVAEVVFLYLLAPGRLQPTFTGMQPDSLQYLCRGLQMAPIPDDAVPTMFQSIAMHFGYPGQQCTADSPVPWFFYSRLLLPWLAAIVAIPQIAAIIPLLGAVLYVAFAVVWTRLFVHRIGPASARGRLLLIAVCLAPLASPTLAIWLGAFLTESLSLALLTASLLLLAVPARFRVASLVAVIALGVLMLLTRQLAPIVASLWCVALLLLIRRLRPQWLSSRARYAVAAAVTAVLSVVAAVGASSVIEKLATPSGQGDGGQLQQGLGGLSQLAAVIGDSLTSTSMDVATAVGRLDLITIVTVAGSLVAVVFLIVRRRSLLLVPVLVSWAYGAYSTGFVAAEYDMFSTHFRLYLPAVVATLAVVGLQFGQTNPATPARLDSDPVEA